jgi:hypothetical protein
MCRLTLTLFCSILFVAVSASDKRPLIRCATDQEVYASLARYKNVQLVLIGTDYIFHRPLVINGRVRISTQLKQDITFHTLSMPALFEIKKGGHLHLQGLELDGNDIKATHFIYSDSTDRSGILLEKNSFRSFSHIYGCEYLIKLPGHAVMDSIILTKNYFINNALTILSIKTDSINISKSKNQKIRADNNIFINHSAMIMDLMQEPNIIKKVRLHLTVEENTFDNCNTSAGDPLFNLTGVHRSNFFFNSFASSNPGKKLVAYHDAVEAQHIFTRNILTRSGTIEPNQYVTETHNTIQ